jgi:hypothetical protein
MCRAELVPLLGMWFTYWQALDGAQVLKGVCGGTFYRLDGAFWLARTNAGRVLYERKSYPGDFSQCLNALRLRLPSGDQAVTQTSRGEAGNLLLPDTTQEKAAVTCTASTSTGTKRLAEETVAPSKRLCLNLPGTDVRMHYVDDVNLPHENASQLQCDGGESGDAVVKGPDIAVVIGECASTTCQSIFLDTCCL